MNINQAQRFTTLDVFRGMTIFLMIVVNTGGSGAEPYAPLLHAAWNGCTLTDLVFPSFLFAVGNAMPFAMKKNAETTKSSIAYKILKRSFLIFLIGYLLGWYTTMHWSEAGLSFPPLFKGRVLAVLQRIALCYFLAAIIVNWFSVRSILALSFIFLLGYWILLYAFGDTG